MTDCKPVQFRNAKSSIVFTLDGMVMDVKHVRPENARVAILVTVEGMLVFLAPYRSLFDEASIIQFLPPPSLYTVFPDATLIFAKFEQPSNTSSPRNVTLAGMVMEVMVAHPLNAFCCIPVTVYVVLPYVTVEGTVKFAGIVPEMQQSQLSSLSSSHNVAVLPSTVNDHRVPFPSVQIL